MPMIWLEVHAILMQEEKVIAYEFRKLKKTKLIYPIHD